MRQDTIQIHNTHLDVHSSGMENNSPTNSVLTSEILKAF